MISAAIFTVVSTLVVARVCKGLPGGHYTDFTPDYPAGIVGLSWLILNGIVWFLAF